MMKSDFVTPLVKIPQRLAITSLINPSTVALQRSFSYSSLFPLCHCPSASHLYLLFCNTKLQYRIVFCCLDASTFGSMLNLHDLYQVLLSLSICCSLCLKPSPWSPLFFHQRPIHLLKLETISQYLWDECLSFCSAKGGFLFSLSHIFYAFLHRSFTHCIKIVSLSPFCQVEFVSFLSLFLVFIWQETDIIVGSQ